MMLNKKILVTGSSGYIGKHLCLYLAKCGYHVTGLDMVGDGIGCHEFLHRNILTGRQVQGEFDSVVHLAALVQVGGGQRAMMDYYRTNVVGTMNMLEKLDYKNFIFASTCQAQMLDNHVYGTTKGMAEVTVRQYCQLNNKKHTIFRFGNVMGSAGYPPTNTDGLLYKLMQAKESGVFHLYGDDYGTPDGTAERDYVHVMEICHGIEKAIQYASCVPGAEVQPHYEYLGHGQFYTVMECVEAFKKTNNCDFEVVVKPRRDGDPVGMNVYDISPYMITKFATLEEMMKV